MSVKKQINTCRSKCQTVPFRNAECDLDLMSWENDAIEERNGLCHVFGQLFGPTFSFSVKPARLWVLLLAPTCYTRCTKVVNISSSGFGSNSCNLFSLRPEMAFVCQGRSIFTFLPNSIYFFFFNHFNVTNSCISFIWHLKRQEVIDPGKKLRALCQTSLVKERRLTSAIVCLAFKATVLLLLGVCHVVCVGTLLIRMNLNTWWNLF